MSKCHKCNAKSPIITYCHKHLDEIRKIAYEMGFYEGQSAKRIKVKEARLKILKNPKASDLFY